MSIALPFDAEEIVEVVEGCSSEPERAPSPAFRNLNILGVVEYAGRKRC
jgi:hypothetical protein